MNQVIFSFFSNEFSHKKTVQNKFLSFMVFSFISKCEFQLAHRQWYWDSFISDTKWRPPKGSSSCNNFFVLIFNLIIRTCGISDDFFKIIPMANEFWKNFQLISLTRIAILSFHHFLPWNFDVQINRVVIHELCSWKILLFLHIAKARNHSFLLYWNKEYQMPEAALCS